MKIPFNKFFKAQSQKLAYEMAFFSSTQLDEQHDFSEPGSYPVMIGLDPAKMIMLTVDGIDFYVHHRPGQSSRIKVTRAGEHRWPRNAL